MKPRHPAFGRRQQSFSEARVFGAPYSPIDEAGGALGDTMSGNRREIVFLGLGSNLGDRLANLEYACERIAQVCELLAVSPVYETEYVGDDHGPQPPFLNCVAKVFTAMPPKHLLAKLKDIEASRGKRPTDHWKPRTLDIDILLYGSLCMDDPELQIPHPRMWQRAFVLTPLSDLEPTMLGPEGTPIADIAAHLQRAGQIVSTEGALLWRASALTSCNGGGGW